MEYLVGSTFVCGPVGSDEEVCAGCTRGGCWRVAAFNLSLECMVVSCVGAVRRTGVMATVAHGVVSEGGGFLKLRRGILCDA